MAKTSGPRKKVARPKKKSPGEAAVIHFTATQKGSVRQRPKKKRPKGDDGDVWVLIGPISWIKYTHKGIKQRTKKLALKALKRFRKR